ncbi:BglG family transcription antiterminator [Paenibacillus sp. GCM10023248]|uniref:BglG family transcription antiterminator n=1 Tax=Bacillales TaxID=1385 RepID=UPI002378C4E5|nr:MULTISPECIES: BglG family transcription antiterminator [Bacillales]MDD9267277.1 BglG family transcription antiterminator [Paenibacillus sp. MAHUQ-63]MDR6884778.1 mannitol operon transcriptional antiterminator [Bacillus sp. 3255]
MRLTHRHRQILELLLRREGEVTAGEIAAEINVSTRTVHRELADLETIVQNAGLTLQKKSGKGMLLQGDSAHLDAFKRSLLAVSASEYSAQDRKLYILCTLLQEAEPVKLFTLSHELSVTIPTITNDLDELEGWVQKSDLILVRRRGYGVGLSGSEANMRRMISRMARHYLDESDLFGKPDQPLTPVMMKLLALIGKEHFAKVEEALWQVEDEGLNALSEEAYTQLLIHISIAVSRIKQGRGIELQAEKQSVRQSELLAQLIGHLSSKAEVEFSTAETAYIAGLLERGEAPHPNQLLPQEELSYMEIVWKLVRQMEAHSGVPYSSDRSLRDGLLSHLESALKRLQAGVGIRNPLLAQIKKDYEALFEGIRRAVDETITGIALPDEEIGYLVMHFGASLERQKQFRRNVRAILVCTSGLGTSKMLAVRLTKELPQIDIIGHASWFEAARIPEKEYDLIVSTVDLPLDNDQYIKLSPLLTKEEAERLRLFIQNVTLKKDDIRQELGPIPEVDATTDRLYRIKQYVNEIVRIIDQFTVHHVEQSFDSLQATLREICGYAKLTHVIEDVEPIVELLLARERQSSQVIPDTGLALFHIRSELVKAPFLTLFRLQQDLVLDQLAPSGVRQVLLMLGPQQLSKESLEVLSEISSYLLIPQMIELLKEGSQSEIKQFLSQELEGFLENKS